MRSVKNETNFSATDLNANKWIKTKKKSYLNNIIKLQEVTQVLLGGFDDILNELYLSYQ